MELSDVTSFNFGSIPEIKEIQFCGTNFMICPYYKRLGRLDIV